MTNKILYLIVGMILLISLIGATCPEMPNLGTFKQGDVVTIKTAINSTWVNITSINYPNGTIAVQNKIMSGSYPYFYYTFADTIQIGSYNYDYLDSNGDIWIGCFDITSSGNSGSANIVFIIFIIIAFYTIAFIGFFGRNTIITVIGGMALLFLGVYMVSKGIIIYRDNLTLYFSYFTIGMGGILALWAGTEEIRDQFG